MGRAIGGESVLVAITVAEVTFVLSDDVEKGHGNEATGSGDQGITGLVPVGIVLAADDVEEVPLGEGEGVEVGGVRRVVVTGTNDLFGRENGSGGLGSDGEMVGMGGTVFVSFDGATQGL